MEGANPHPLNGTAAAKMLDEPLPHFIRSLIGEGDGRDVRRLHLLLSNQPGNAGNERFRFASARPGSDDHGLFRRGNRSFLPLVQPIEQVVRHWRCFGLFWGGAF